LYSPKPVNNVMVGAEGLNIEIQIREGYNPLNISTATTKNIILEKPSGAKIIVSASFTSNGTDGKFYFVTSGSDLDESGIYSVQGFVNLGTFSGYSTTTTFEVKQNL
jgi:hypothetical protein